MATAMITATYQHQTTLLDVSIYRYSASYEVNSTNLICSVVPLFLNSWKLGDWTTLPCNAT